MFFIFYFCIIDSFIVSPYTIFCLRFQKANSDLIITFVSFEELLVERNGEESGKDTEEYEAKMYIGDTGDEKGGDLKEEKIGAKSKKKKNWAKSLEKKIGKKKGDRRAWKRPKEKSFR